ncbi:MAG: hypothetical protein JWR85_2243 [Marmoricola sp.]|nr:hypothetical protein [Marmoricola sp.]
MSTTITRTAPVAPARPWARLRRDVTTAVFFGALLVGIVLRIAGLTFGLPLELHPDEFVIVSGAVDLAHRHSFAPMYFMRPDHVEIQLSHAAYQIYSHLVMGTDVDAAYAQRPEVFLLISRSITAVFGIATIVLAYLIGRRFDRRIGAMAAVLFALMPALVRDAHFATPDIPLTCMLMAVVLALMHYLARPRLVPLLAACAATAVGIAIKYPAAIATLMIATVVIVSAIRDRRLRRILTHGVASIVSVLAFVFVVSPVLFTDFAAVRDQLSQQSGSTHLGADGLGWGGNLAFYVGSFFTGAGLLLCLLSAVGAFIVVRLRMLEATPLVLGAVYWIVLSAVPLHWERWAFPMYITPLLLAPIGALHAYRWVGARRWRAPVAWLVGGLVVANLLAGSVAVVSTLVAPDTRVTARDYLQEAGITTEVSAYEGYSPLRPGQPKPVFAEFTIVDGQPRAKDPDVRYLVLSSCTTNRYLEDPKFNDERAFYKAVRAHLPLLRSWSHVVAADRTGIEPADIVQAVRVPVAFLGGQQGGCDVQVYATR